MLHVIGVEKNSLASTLGAQNVERHFAVNVIRRGAVKVAFDVVGRLKI
jgi:sialic acid synthase SpsE